MLKVAHVISGLGRGGAESVLTRLVTRPAGTPSHVVVSLSGEGHFGPKIRAAGVPVYALSLKSPATIVAAVPQLARLLRRESPDVVQTWMYHGNLIGGLAARAGGVAPVVWGIRNTNLEVAAIGASARLAAWFGALASRSIPAAIVCPSWESRRVHARFGYDDSRFRMIPNGYDTSLLRPDADKRAAIRRELGFAQNDVVIGNVARWDPQKDHANLLGACARLRADHPTLRVLLVGEGMVPANQDLVSLVRRFDLSSCVVLAGPRDDVAGIMNALDVHALSSYGEAFPNAVAEAMACGTPSVATDVGDAARIVGDTGWIAEPRDDESLAEALSDALRAVESEGRSAIGQRSRRRIESEYSLETMLRLYNDVWTSVAESQRHTALKSSSSGAIF